VAGTAEGAGAVWPQLQALPWLQAPGSAACQRLALQLSGPLRASRMRAGLPPVGAVVLCGGPSSGKTALCAALALRLHQDAACRAHVERVACAELAQEQAGAARAKLVQSMRRASVRLPAVVVLDDLDALVAAGAADPGGDAGTDGPTTRLLGLLSDLLDTVQVGSLCHPLCPLLLWPRPLLLCGFTATASPGCTGVARGSLARNDLPPCRFPLLSSRALCSPETSPGPFWQRRSSTPASPASSACLEGMARGP